MMMGKMNGHFRADACRRRALGAVASAPIRPWPRRRPTRWSRPWPSTTSSRMDPGEAFEISRRRDHRQHLRPAGAPRRQRHVQGRGRPRRKLDGFRRRPDLHVQAEARPEVRLRQPDHRRGRRLFASSAPSCSTRARPSSSTQFGLTKDNVTEKAKAADPLDLRVHGRQGLCAELRAQLPDGHRRLGRRQEAGAGACRAVTRRRLQVRQ